MRRFMSQLFLCFACLCAAHGAWADTVVTRTGGSLFDPNYLLGGAEATGPYVLEIRSEFDPATMHSLNNGAYVTTPDSDITITLTVGGYTSSYTTHGMTSLWVGYSGGTDPVRQFMHTVMYYDGYRTRSTTDLWQTLKLPDGAFAGNHALQPIALDMNGQGVPGGAGYLSGSRNEDWGDVYITWGQVSATDEWYSLQILTDVPEPANAGMLAAGLLVLVPVLRRRPRA